MGNASGTNVSIVSECSGSNDCTQIFPGFLALDVAESSFAKATQQCQFGISGKKHSTIIVIWLINSKTTNQSIALCLQSGLGSTN